MEMPQVLFTIANGSRIGGHVTSIATTVEELIEEINSTLACDEQMTLAIIEEYNETAETLGRPKFEGTVDDFDFDFIAKNDPQTDKGGWGWAWDYVNSQGEDDHGYLNISVHKCSGKYFMTEG
jgi:hypothetical protein